MFGAMYLKSLIFASIRHQNYLRNFRFIRKCTSSKESMDKNGKKDKTDSKNERTAFINMKAIYGENFCLPYCKDGVFPLNLSILYDPKKSSSHVSKCMTLTGKDKRFILYSKISNVICYFSFGGTQLLTGSYSDGSKIDHSDLDFLYILDTETLIVGMQNCTDVDKSRGECYLADLSSTPPGFTKIRSSIDQSYLSTPFYLPQVQGRLSQQLKVKQLGPSSQVSTTEGVLLGDCVYAMQCSNWPPGERDKWLDRYRPFGWPPKHVVEDLSKTRCFVVPVGREDSEFSNMEWRFAFPFVERGLVSSFNNTQLQCFLLLKYFNMTFLKTIDVNNDGINTFHIKMVMFWECENSDPKDWCEENLFDCVCRCLCRLRLAIEQRELKHFIIEKRNVLVTKLKNSETREKVLKTIRMIENDIIGSFIICILDKKNVSLILGMVGYQYILNKSKTSFDYTKIMFSRLAWLDTISRIVSSITTLMQIGYHSQISVLKIRETKKSISSTIDILLGKIKKEKNSESITNHAMSRFMREIILIGNSKICYKEIENILLRVRRICIGSLNILIGSRLFEKATKICGVQKRDILLKAEKFFKKGVKMDDLAGQLHLATFYIACGNDKSEKILTSMFKQNRVLVYCGNAITMYDAILISDGNIKITCGILQDYRHGGYAMSIWFHNHDLQRVPDVLKYEMYMQGGEILISLNPFVYAKYMQILLSIKSKSILVTQYIKELRQCFMPKLYISRGSMVVEEINILAYCYKHIGLTNEAIYYYMHSIRSFSNDENAAVFHLAFLLNQINQTEIETVKET